MKKYTLLIIFMTFLGTCFSQTDNFYYYKGEKINLPINSKMFYIVLSDTLDWASNKLTTKYTVSTCQKGIQYASKEKLIGKLSD